MRLCMLIVDEQEHGGKNSRLLQKDVDWPSVPREGDLVQICGQDGFNAYVKHVFLCDDGTIEVDLKTLIVDPNEITQNAMSPAWHNYCSTWWTATDGEPPDAKMIEHGWEKS